MSILFQPLTLGDLQIKNRIIMAPLTRARSGDVRIPNQLMRDYYVQRSSAGLILTEATSITPQGVGYAKTPGIWNEDQVKGWKEITESVHAKGSKIFLQLWHVGRISHPVFLNGELPVAPSALKPSGHVSLITPTTEFVTPRALALEEIPGIVEDYKKAALNAKLAGFDGVEIHAANSYLIEQFIRSESNARTDAYGGSVENRVRFLLEIVDAVVSVWGAARVGVHLSPRRDQRGVGDVNLKETYEYIAGQLGARKIAFLFIREAQGEDYLTPSLKEKFKGVVIANEGLNFELGSKLVEEGTADAVSFGKDFISNPDLVDRFQKKTELQKINPETLYAGGAEGYTDYPFHPLATQTLNA